MKSNQHRLICQVPLLTTLVLLPTSLKAVVLLNGDLNGTPGISSTATSWTASSMTPDLTNPGGIAEGLFIYANLVPASPNGGTFAIVETSTSAIEGFSQIVTGLIPGASYQVSFAQSQVAAAAVGAPTTPIFTDPVRWSVTFSGTTQLSPIETFTGFGTQAWTPVTLAGFIATSDTETLDFTSFLPAGSTQGYLGIDGIVILQIPEPTSTYLLGLGAFATVLRRRVKK